MNTVNTCSGNILETVREVDSILTIVPNRFHVIVVVCIVLLILIYYPTAVITSGRVLF